MLKRLIPPIALIALALAVCAVLMQKNSSVLSPCEVATDPKSFDGKTLRVRGTLSVHFENFSLDAGNCGSHPGVWLAFGGDVPGIVVSTVNDSFRKPGADLQVNGVAYGIKKDENFRKLYDLIGTRRSDDDPVYRVTATLTGTFFAGEQSGSLPGYGHLGCCFLFVIKEVEDVDSVPPANLQVRGAVLRPDGRPAEGFVVFSDVLGGTPPQRQETTTDEKGEFTFLNSGQLLRFENPSYRPIALPVETRNEPIRVTLENSQSSDWLVPPCGQAQDRTTRIGYGILFALPKTMEAESFNSNGMSSYFVFPRGNSSPEAELIVSRTSGGADRSSSDFKSSKQRWLKDSKGTLIGIDSLGQLESGEHWRGVHFRSNDTADYSIPAGKQTNVLDAIIDSACIAHP